jgi:hypothetical protein
MGIQTKSCCHNIDNVYHHPYSQARHIDCLISTPNNLQPHANSHPVFPRQRTSRPHKPQCDRRIRRHRSTFAAVPDRWP